MMNGRGWVRVAAVLGSLAFLPACGGRRSSFCDALGADVRSLQPIAWANGLTSEQGVWAHVLDTGITRASRPSRLREARAVRSDEAGYRSLLSTAPKELRPALDRLHRVVLNPNASDASRNDPQLARDIAAVRSATPPSKCNWSR